MIFERYVNEIASIVLNALMIQALLVTTINLNVGNSFPTNFSPHTKQN